MDPETGEKKLVGSIPDVKVGPQHEGVLGIALDPDLGKNGSKNNVYVAHTYMDGGGNTPASSGSTMIRRPGRLPIPK